ncbi:PucR family transcriptional regulator [Granulicoccus phenolivorans]|uniref:PucR family transcriptional regulator n=1 Tax=Granulicoccus phenolivorans TaxID=266854 RepID=UPI000420D6B4|nr:helix-turn-helix domain-containing protein [Granulicoccus phenolivorans]
MSEVATIRRILRQLDWDGPTTPPMDEQTRLIQADLGDGAVRWMVGTVEAAFRELKHGEHPDMLAPWAKIRVLAHGMAAQVLLDLLGAAPVADPDPDPGLVEDLVSRDVDMTKVVYSLRVLQNLWISTLVEAALRVPDGGSTVPALVQTVTRVVDRAADRLNAAVLAERRLVLQRGRAQIRHMIEAMVAGQLLDERVATDTLGIPIGGWHLGCVLHAPPGAEVARGEVDAAVTAFAELSGGDPLLRHETSEGQVWLWASGFRARRFPTGADLRLQSPLTAGIGEPHQGITGFRRTHLEAADALRIGLLCRQRMRTHQYRDEGLAALLSQDAERAQWFVHNELGELAEDTPEMAELRHTLRTYFGAQMRIAPAAETLYLHRNTLRDRLQRIERILGYQLAHRSAECQAALRLCELSDRGENPPTNGRRFSGSDDLRTFVESVQTRPRP